MLKKKKDEMGANVSLSPLYAWSRRGARAFGSTPRNWGKNVTLLASITAEGLGWFFFSSRRRHTRSLCDWSSDVCSSDLIGEGGKVNEILITHGGPATKGG